MDETEECYPGVYYVEAQPQDETVLLAFQVKRLGDQVSWLDTMRERVMAVDEHSWRVCDNGRISFNRVGGENPVTYSLLPLTLRLYRKHVKPRIGDGKMDFKTKAEMYKKIIGGARDCN